MAREARAWGLLLVALLLPPATPGWAGSDPLDVWDELLARHVAPGGVRYRDWRSRSDDVEALSAVVAAFSATEPARLSPAERTALYINLYNARIVELVLEHDPPDSIRQVSRARFGYGVFFKKLIDFDGSRISLNGLEKRLRRESGDPRIHFAINCASRSCPALAAEAYRPERLEQQLERRTRAALASARLLTWEPSRDGRHLTIGLSKIFDWFAEDFETAGGVRTFLARYGPPGLTSRLKEREDRVRFFYLDYDWTLNAAP